MFDIWSLYHIHSLDTPVRALKGCYFDLYPEKYREIHQEFNHRNVLVWRSEALLLSLHWLKAQAKLCAWGGCLFSLFVCAFGSCASMAYGIFPGNWSSCFLEPSKVLHHLASGVRVFVWGWVRVMKQRITYWVEHGQISLSVCLVLLILAVAPSCYYFLDVMTIDSSPFLIFCCLHILFWILVFITTKAPSKTADFTSDLIS